MTGRPIPTEAAAITPDWLEAALTEQDAARREVCTLMGKPQDTQPDPIEAGQFPPFVFNS